MIQQTGFARKLLAPLILLSLNCLAGDGPANVNAQDELGKTALYQAASRGDTRTMEALLKAGALADLPTLNGYTPLHVAAQNGHADAVMMLIRADANIHAQTPTQGFTPMHFAATNDHPDVITTLFICEPTTLNAPSKHGNTPLYYAARENKLNAVQALLMLPGITIDNNTILHASPETREILLQARARIDTSPLATTPQPQQQPTARHRTRPVVPQHHRRQQHGRHTTQRQTAIESITESAQPAAKRMRRPNDSNAAPAAASASTMLPS